MAPRISDEDFRSSDDFELLADEGTWVRCPLYPDGHLLVDRHGSLACGRSIPVDPTVWYDAFRGAMSKLPVALYKNGKVKTADPGDWYFAVDTRKGNKCGPCKAKAPQLVALRKAQEKSRENTEMWLSAERKHGVIRYRDPNKRRIQELRERQKLTWLRHYLTFEEETDGGDASDTRPF